jgi:hypothetical protein
MPAFTKTITIGNLTAASSTAVAASQSGSSITINGGLATGGVATMDQARRIAVTSGGNDTSITFTLTGTDRYGRVQSESFAGASGAAAQSVKDYATITKVVPTGAVATYVTVGTTGVASSDAYINDWIANGNLIRCSTLVTGTINYTIQEAVDDFAPAWDQTVNSANWFADSTFSASTTSQTGTLSGPFSMIRILVNSGTGTVQAKLITPFIGGAI